MNKSAIRSRQLLASRDLAGDSGGVGFRHDGAEFVIGCMRLVCHGLFSGVLGLIVFLYLFIELQNLACLLDIIEIDVRGEDRRDISPVVAARDAGG